MAAKLIETRYGKRKSKRSTDLGRLYTVSASGTGGSETQAKKDRLSLHFSSVGADGIERKRALWLDYDEAVMIARQVLRGGAIADVVEAAKANEA